MNIMLILVMDKNASRKYLRSLNAEDRKKLADIIGISQEYLFMIGAGNRTPSRKIAAKLEIETKGQIKAVDFDREVKHAMSA
jgi:DNA-binding XRE family transcriptional regulator